MVSYKSFRLTSQIYRSVQVGTWRSQQQNYWTEAVQMTKTNDRPDLSSEGAPDIDKTVNVEQ
jgi:hypothetical protein